MSSFAAPSLWRPDGIAIPRSCADLHRRRRWRRWLELFSAVSGDEILDDNGNVVLDASGNAVTSDGAGDVSYCADPNCIACMRGTLKTHCSLEFAGGLSFFSGCFPTDDKYCTGTWDDTLSKVSGGISGTYDLTWSGGCSYAYSAVNNSCVVTNYISPGCTGGIHDTLTSSTINLNLQLLSTGPVLRGFYSFAGVGAYVWFANGTISGTSLYDCGQILSFTNNNFICSGNVYNISAGVFEVLAKGTTVATASFS